MKGGNIVIVLSNGGELGKDLGPSFKEALSNGGPSLLPQARNSSTQISNDTKLDKKVTSKLVWKGLGQSLSDHYPVILGELVVDWGPKPFRFLKVWKALSDCEGIKAPGSDGLNFNFIKANWELIKEKQLGMLNGATFGDGAVHISHLQFVDDTILFLEPKLEYLMNAKRILRCVDGLVAKVKRASVGSPPPIFDLSFNVDGSSRGSPGETGISGVLCDSSVKILCLFSFHVGSPDVVTAEVLAIHKACQLISGKVYLARRCITIFCDSKSVVAWIKDSDFGNLQLVHLVYDIHQFMKSSAGFDIMYIPWESNSFTDSLAKAASNSGRDRLEWGDV
ncbi:hypothetical protein Ddye_021604 [Dipteronia dyeriana]|uniref:RNase H type-1 domain-containing protein n=1 Tax=Dipteronia dyeriana TaxID=168575 RepID=A0AAD9WWG5_9ROSI|nr:hypothetical protein Ddye_021604 [Dipteronia dyeriana]